VCLLRHCTFQLVTARVTRKKLALTACKSDKNRTADETMKGNTPYNSTCKRALILGRGVSRVDNNYQTRLLGKIR